MILVVASAFSTPCYSAENDQVRKLWPPPDNEPWLEYIGIYSSDEDFSGSMETQIQGALGTFLGTNLNRKIKTPTSMITLDRNTFLISERNSDNIVVFDLRKGQSRNLFKTVFPLFNNPVDLAVDSEKKLYVLDQEKAMVSVFNSDFSPSHTIGSQAGLIKPEKIALHPEKDIVYISDSTLNKIFAFDAADQLQFIIGEEDNSDAHLKSPHGMAINQKNELYVADTGNAQIKVFNAEGGAYIRTIKFSNGAEGSILKKPWDLSFDSTDLLHIVDQSLAAIMTCNTQGVLHLATRAKQRTNHLMGFNRPYDIHIDEDDRIFVTDMLNNRISVWQRLTDTYLAENPITQADIKALKEYIRQSKEEYAKNANYYDMAAATGQKKQYGGEEVAKMEQGKRKKLQKITCPNCSKEYYLQFIGTDKDNSFY